MRPISIINHGVQIDMLPGINLGNSSGNASPHDYEDAKKGCKSTAGLWDFTRSGPHPLVSRFVTKAMALSYTDRHFKSTHFSSIAGGYGFSPDYSQETGSDCPACKLPTWKAQPHHLLCLESMKQRGAFGAKRQFLSDQSALHMEN